MTSRPLPHPSTIQPVPLCAPITLGDLMDYPTLRTVRPRAKAIFYRLYGRTCATPHGFYDSQGFVGACNESMSRTLIYNQIYNRLLNKEMQKTIPCRCTFTSPEMPVRIPSARCPLHAKEIIQ